MELSDFCYLVIVVVGVCFGVYGYGIATYPEPQGLEDFFDKPLPEIWLDTVYLLLIPTITLPISAILVRKFVG